MRIDLPTCGFKSCRYCFDGNCTKKVEYDRCEYREYKNSLRVHGQWETNSDRPDSLICSVCKCGFDMWKHDPHNYCLNCGAIMDGGANNAANGNV